MAGEPRRRGADPARVSLSELLALGRPAASLALGGRQLPGAAPPGGFVSPLRGRGMEFEESRPYSPGDDVRHLDWRATARSGRAHTKIFRQERERPVFVWLDLRAAMRFATCGAYKAVLACRMAALLMWVALRHGDRLGAVVFADDGHREFRPRRGRLAVLHLLRYLAGHPIWRGGRRYTAVVPEAASDALERLSRVVRPGSLLFLLSDFRGLDEGAARSCLASLSGHCEIFLVFFFDRLECELPPPGRYRISDGRQRMALHVAGEAMAADHRRRFAARRKRLQDLAYRYRLRLLECRTDADPLIVLQRGLGRRPLFRR
ncbi:MAG: DUF58 domain-containing protein [Gammaproteobacteria bacterium]|nr:DUF58 domain-containing protein [Gammaproteobacteria bacterium]MDD9864000.1 DUF58 domain-containing protein [Gammaproteobacteria bacterium]